MKHNFYLLCIFTLFQIILSNCVPLDPEKSNVFQKPKFQLSYIGQNTDSSHKLKMTVIDPGYKNKINSLSIAFGLNDYNSIFNKRLEIANELTKKSEFETSIYTLPNAKYDIWGYAINDYDTTFSDKITLVTGNLVIDSLYQLHFLQKVDTIKNTQKVSWQWKDNSTLKSVYHLSIINQKNEKIFEDDLAEKSKEITFSNEKTGVSLTAKVIPNYGKYGFGKISSANKTVLNFSKPSITAPQNESLLDGTTQEIQATKFEYADKYIYEIANKNTNIVKTIGGTSNKLSLENLEEEHTYSVKVKVTNTITTSEWSDAINFSISNVAGTPSLTSPTSNYQIKASQFNFEWTKVAGAVEYEIQLSNDYNFNINVVKYTTSTNNLNVFNIPADCYYWRVRAKNKFDYGPFSEQRQGIRQIDSPSFGSYCQTMMSGNSTYYYCTVNVYQPKGANSMNIDFSGVNNGTLFNNVATIFVYPGQSVKISATAYGSCSSSTGSTTITK